MDDVEICVQCDQAFHEDDNDEKSCFYHPELEEDEDSDVWVDWDERCHGPIDTEINRKSFPDGFVYGCCGKNGLTKGCTWGEHPTASDPEDVMNAYIERHVAAHNAKRVKLNPGGVRSAATLPAKKVVNLPPTPHTCVQCSVVFYETGNSETSCRYHDGETYLDKDAKVWPQMKGLEDFTEKDNNLTRGKYPGGFRYSCCKRTLEPGQEGCKQGKHKAAEVAGVNKSTKDEKASKKADSEDNENQAQEVIEISDDSE